MAYLQMKAVVYNKFGGPEVLEYVDHPSPERAAGDLLVRIKSTSVNPVDCKIRQGKLPFAKRQKVQAFNNGPEHAQTPYKPWYLDHSHLCLQILGGDLCGVVEAADEKSPVS